MGDADGGDEEAGEPGQHVLLRAQAEVEEHRLLRTRDDHLERQDDDEDPELQGHASDGSARGGGGQVRHERADEPRHADGDE